MKGWKAGMFKDLFAHIRMISHKANLPLSLVKLMPGDNLQVAGYLPSAAYSIPASVYDQLIQFKEERGLESTEVAVTVILSEYFGLLQIPATTDTTTSRLENLEAKCNLLSETVAELQTALATLQSSSSQSVGYKDSPHEQPQVLPLQNNHANPAIALSSGQKDSQLESTPNIQEQQNLEKQSGETFNTPMTQADLAKRLGVATSTVSRMQSKSNFPEWSKLRDPDSVAWVKSPDTKLFSPQSDEQG